MKGFRISIEFVVFEIERGKRNEIGDDCAAEKATWCWVKKVWF